MTILVLSRWHPFAGTSRSRRRTRFTPSPANAVRASPTSPRSGRRARQQRSIRGQNRLCALGDPNETIPGKLAAAPNPHRRPSLHRFSAGSFFGGFRTPALLPRVPLAPGRHPKTFPLPDLPYLALERGSSDPFQTFGPAHEIETPAPLGLAEMRAYTTFVRPEENTTSVSTTPLTQSVQLAAGRLLGHFTQTAIA